MIKLRRIVGESMVPALQPGDIVIARKPGKTKVGDIVMANIGDREIIKRVARVESNEVYLLGDNALHSTDSRSFGSVPHSAIVGTIMTRLRLAKPTPPPKVASKRLLTIPYALAAFFTVVLLVLLLRMGTFVQEIDLLMANVSAARITAGLSALLLLLALPFLLRMRVSPLMRAVSAVASLLAPIISMFVVPFLFVRSGNDYLFGANADAASVWSVAVFGALLAISLWSFHILGGQHAFARLKPKKH